MMKKKNRHSLRGLILFLTALSLVVAITIFTTLAYLSDYTISRENFFQGAPDIKGETVEPYGQAEGSFDGDSTVNYSYQPGNEYAKDPLIHNKTTDAEVYVGARVDFYIAVTKSGDNPVYRQVPYSLFSQYVSINGWNTGAGSGQWEEIDVPTAKTANDNTVTADAGFSSALGTRWSKYYVYNDVLDKAGSPTESVTTDTNNHAYTIGSAANQSGSTSSAKTSITSPLFTGVTPNGRITVSDTLPTANGGSSGGYATVLYADGPQFGDVYQCFDFRIVVNGYGVAAESAAVRSEVIEHLKADMDLPTVRIDVSTPSATNAQLKASHS